MSLSALWVWWAGVSVGRPAAWSLQEGTVESRETTSASLSFRRRREGGTWKERPSSIHNIYQKSRKEKCIVQQRNGRNRYQGCLIKNEWDKSGEGIKSHKSQTMFPNFKKDPQCSCIHTHRHTCTHSSTSFWHNPEVRAEFISLNHADEHDLGRPWHPVTSAPLSSLALHLWLC